jgi:CBS domain-containing protein
LIRTKEVMWRSPPTAKPDEEAKAARERMEGEGIDWLAVIDDEGRFTGWVVSSNLERGQKVKEVMSTSAITATRKAVLSEALSLMLTSGLNVLAIVDQHNRLEGVLTFQAIQEALREAAQ